MTVCVTDFNSSLLCEMYVYTTSCRCFLATCSHLGLLQRLNLNAHKTLIFQVLSLSYSMLGFRVSWPSTPWLSHFYQCDVSKALFQRCEYTFVFEQSYRRFLRSFYFACFMLVAVTSVCMTVCATEFDNSLIFARCIIYIIRCYAVFRQLLAASGCYRFAFYTLTKLLSHQALYMFDL